MGGVLVVAETRRGELREATLELITAGASIKAQAGGPLSVAVVGREPGAFAAEVACDGVDELIAVRSDREHFEAHAWEHAVAGLVEAERPALVLLSHSVDSMGFAPAVAARLGTGFASDATALRWRDGPLVERGAYSDKLVAELDFPGRDTVLVMLRPGAYSPAPADAAEPPVRVVDTPAAEPRSEHLGFVEVEAGDVDITKADFLLSIGRGIEDGENVARFERLADRIGATLAVSRPLVDAGWAPSARQVGQSGKTVKPKVYLALGISGAVQHLAGMRSAETIIAVNQDPEAPIFSVAHYGAVADLFEVADELEERF